MKNVENANITKRRAHSSTEQEIDQDCVGTQRVGNRVVATTRSVAMNKKGEEKDNTACSCSPPSSELRFVNVSPGSSPSMRMYSKMSENVAASKRGTGRGGGSVWSEHKGGEDKLDDDSEDDYHHRSIQPNQQPSPSDSGLMFDLEPPGDAPSIISNKSYGFP
jgi:hypothetical protein